MLTNMAVSNAKPRTVAYKMADGKGLYLYILKSGGKSWRYDYKIKNLSTDTIDRAADSTDHDLNYQALLRRRLYKICVL